MHIPTEILLIILRNAGIKASHSRNGFAETEIYSCSSCGICIDACPMSTQKKNLKYTSVYFIRLLRRRNKKSLAPAEKCLMCNKCVEVCPVGIDSCKLKQLKRENNNLNTLKQDFSYLNTITNNSIQKYKVAYYAGCMTHLSPIIYKSLFKIMDTANIDYTFLDKDGSICCGRPMLLSGKSDQAQLLIEKNIELINHSGANLLLVSCPICYKMFKENYSLKGIRVLHHTEYINQLINDSKIELVQTNQSYVFHDPCELGRGSGIYEEPRNILNIIGKIESAKSEKKESICCGGSIGSLTLSKSERDAISLNSLETLTYNDPDNIITACPLCLKTFAPLSNISVKDISQVVAENLK